MRPLFRPLWNGVLLSSHHLIDRRRFIAFKHTKRPYAEALVNAGELRFSRLDVFHNIEHHGIERGDPHEGMTINHTHIQHASFDQQGRLTGDPRAFLVAGRRGDAGPPKGLTIKNSFWITLRGTRDPLLVWCLSKSRSPSIATRMDALNDSCVRVDLSMDMLHELRLGIEASGLHVREFALGEVAYVPGGVIDDASPHAFYPPWLVKDTRYQYQEEVRVVFWCSGDVPNHLTLQIRKSNFSLGS